ncbi:hypothetical protein EI42_04008 [Thermosporothrix hazakensis]|uniref:Uncharacterized protein n=1 Tax=Thermosporothrix hazakensis TaxID=644383 RepID=A0A326UFQ1_THEHA|nr:hypothetical protein EI42_04008 [Thermosporothrix hazakensis]
MKVILCLHFESLRDDYRHEDDAGIAYQPGTKSADRVLVSPGFTRKRALSSAAWSPACVGGIAGIVALAALMLMNA